MSEQVEPPVRHTHKVTFIFGPGQSADFTTAEVEPILGFMRLTDPMATFLVRNPDTDRTTVISRGAVSLLHVEPIQ